MSLRRETKAQESVWTTGDFSQCAESLCSKGAVAGAITAAIAAINDRDFQARLSLDFEGYSAFANRLLDAITDSEEVAVAEDFTTRCLQHASIAVFLYGIVWVKRLLWGGADQQRLSFVTQAKSQLCKLSAAARRSADAKDGVTRCILILVAVTAQDEINAVYDECVQRGDHCALVKLAEFATVSDAQFQKLTAQAGATSAAEVVTAVCKAIQYHSASLFPQSILATTQSVLAFVSSTWKSYQSRPLPANLLPPVIAFATARPLIQAETELKDQLNRATLAAVTMVGNSADSVLSASAWVEICCMIAALPVLEGEVLQRLVNPLRKVIDAGLKVESGAVQVALMRALHVFLEACEDINIAGLIPPAHMQALLAFFDSGVIAGTPDPRELRTILAKYARCSEAPPPNWAEISSAVTQLQQAVGLPPSHAACRPSVLLALEAIKSHLSA